MSNTARMQTPSLLSRAVAGLPLFALSAACDSPTQPSSNRPEPSQTDLSRTHTDLSGTYTLTLSASSRCRLELPEDLRARTYTATIVQARRSLMVTVQYPSPMSWGQPNSFTGSFGGTNEVIFQLGVEEWWLEGGREFHASGSITSTISAGGLSGFLDGDMMALVSNEDGRGNRRITCTAPDHGVVFSRSL